MPASSSSLPSPKFLDAGESAIVVEFGKTVDVLLHDRVLALDAAVNAAHIDGVTETVPTYRSLMVHYDPVRLTREAIVARLQSLVNVESSSRLVAAHRKVPVCFEPPYSEDLESLAQKLGIDAKQIVELFTQREYRLYMYGFLPGFAYLGRLPEQLQVPRRETPRSPVPPGAVIVAGEQVVITGIASPTGWYMIGRTPLRMFDLQRESAFLFDVGDEVTFTPIDAAAYAQ